MHPGRTSAPGTPAVTAKGASARCQGLRGGRGARGEERRGGHRLAGARSADDTGAGPHRARRGPRPAVLGGRVAASARPPAPLAKAAVRPAWWDGLPCAPVPREGLEVVPPGVTAAADAGPGHGNLKGLGHPAPPFLPAPTPAASPQACLATPSATALRSPHAPLLACLPQTPRRQGGWRILGTAPLPEQDGRTRAASTLPAPRQPSTRPGVHALHSAAAPSSSTAGRLLLVTGCPGDGTGGPLPRTRAQRAGEARLVVGGAGSQARPRQPQRAAPEVTPACILLPWASAVCAQTSTVPGGRLAENLGPSPPLQLRGQTRPRANL